MARKHGLALIYDAAHAYGVRHRGESILSYGDASMVSLHATKLFHAAEGGFVVAKDAAVDEKVEWMRRFGHDGNEAYHGVGINAKMSELHAAMGLCVHRHLEEISAARHAACRAYDDGLAKINGVRKAFQLRESTEWNAAYYPIRFDSEELLIAVLEELSRAKIFPRRYFHPALHESLAIKEAADCPHASLAAREVICLPLGASTSSGDVARIMDALANVGISIS